MRFDQLQRRELITLLGGAATWPLVAHAQPADGIRRIGVLLPPPEDDPEYQAFLATFREELRKLGWAEGSNIRMDTRWASAGAASMQRLAPMSIRTRRQTIYSSTNHPCRPRGSVAVAAGKMHTAALSQASL